MADDSVGSIYLDLNVNTRGFDQQLKGIQASAGGYGDKISSSMSKGIGGLATKLGGAMAAALSVKAITNFSAKCLDLGSDLQEVQNVVDVTFPTMSSQIDSFAKSAASYFGLSETMAKKFTGTFGSMAEAFGFSEKEAADMAKTLTGLSGDVSSFYNISQDEAYTKLKSVFSGETETLKDLGIVMTQSALDSYALANGFGKVTSKMTEAEKVSLRFAFVQNQLTNATGDFARTSDSWANQTRILALQFDSLRASIGQGLINVFTPVIKMINILMGKLVSLADRFKSLTNIVTGKKDAFGGMQATADAASEASGSMKSASSSAKKLSKATTAAGKAAKKAKKDMLGLAGFDEINNYSSNKSKGTGSSGSSGGGSGSASGGKGSGTSSSKVSGGSGKLPKGLAAVVKKAKDLGKEFVKGFKDGLGNTDSVFSSIKKSASKIKLDLKDIATDGDVRKSFDSLANTVAMSLGRITGSVASIGLTIADNLIGGFSLFLSQNKDRIKGDLISLFDITSDTAEVVGYFSTVLADIATVFRGDNSKQITADIISVFEDSYVNVALIASKTGRDFIKLLTKPITDNKDAIKQALDNTINPLSTVIHSLSTYVSDTWDSIQSFYDTYISPFIASLREAISQLFGDILDGYNTYVAPVLSNLSKKFSTVMNEHISPAIDGVLSELGEFISLIRALWEKWLLPFVSWVIKTIVPVLAKKFEIFGTIALAAVELISDAVNSVSKVVKGVIKIVRGLIEGDWSTVWDGMKDIVKGAISGIIAILKATGLYNAAKALVNTLIGVINKMLSAVEKGLNSIVERVNELKFTVPDWVPGDMAGKKFGFDLKKISIPDIPALANGAYVRKNTPQLAVIGDNRHQGEVVAPEDKLQKMVDSAINRAQANTADGLVPVIERLCNAIISMESAGSPLSVEKYKEGDLLRVVKNENDNYKRRYGEALI